MPLRNPRSGERTLSPAAAKKARVSVLPKILLLLLAAFVVFFFYYYVNQSDEYKRQKKLNSLYSETLASLEEANAALDEKMKNIYSQDNVEKEAHAQGMIKEGEIIFEEREKD